MITYAAYGSNMNRQQMLARTGGETEAIGTALLRDWQLEFQRGVLTIVPKFGGTVPLALWHISTNARNALDHYEGAPWLYAPSCSGEKASPPQAVTYRMRSSST